MSDELLIRDLLEEPVERAARRVALRLLEKVDAERRRLDDRKDSEALHDFRVAVRRLGSWLRAYRVPLRGSVTGRHRNALRAVARASNGCRDAEAHVAWLRAHKELFRQDRRKGTEWLVRQLQERGRTVRDTLVKQVGRDFVPLRRELRKTLRVYTRRVDAAPTEVSFAVATTLFVHDQAEALRDRIVCVRGRGDEDAAHRARIGAKYLRYLLEPVASAVARAEPLLSRLEHLQDILGELHDAHMLCGEVSSAIVDSAAGRLRQRSLTLLDHVARLRGLWRGKPDPGRRGLEAIDRAVRDAMEESFAVFARDWRGGAANDFWTSVTEVSSWLRTRAPRRWLITRKFLLSGLPKQFRTVRPVNIEHGYLPGARFTERLTRVTGDGTTVFYRGVRVEHGAGRTVVEEGTTPATFDRMWPLTKGRRLAKRRRRLPVGALTWAVDEFSGRRLVLAEIAVPAEGAAVEIPEWLRPFVVREVTDEPQYQNTTLTR
jgi:CHAD domain-containing protein/CYTH domain-containing protein